MVNSKDSLVMLTKTGLAWRTEKGEGDTAFYTDNVGRFRRYMSIDEWTGLCRVCTLVHFSDLYNAIKPVRLPEKWRFLWSWKESDYTSYKPGTSNDGGDYAFHKTHNIFGRMNDGELELLDVIRHTTSAEFPYDEADGSFQNSGMGEAWFIDCEDDFALYTQIGYDQERLYSLQQFGTEVHWTYAIEGMDAEVWSEDEAPRITTENRSEVYSARVSILRDIYGAVMVNRLLYRVS